MEPFALERYFAKHEFSARYLFSSSDCESLSIGELLDGQPNARARFERTWLGYTEAPGSPALRERIASLYATITPDDVLVFSGAQEAIYAFARTTVLRRDRVVVHFPAYQSLYEVAADAGAEILRWTGREDDGWRPDFDRLEAWASLPLRAIVVNTPQNPTGFHFNPEEFEQIERFAERSGAVLFCDEVYRLLEYGARRLPAACDASETAVSLGVLSKSFGLAGLRIGWIATHNREVLRAMARYKDYLTICSSAPSEFLAELALDQRERILARNTLLAEKHNALFDAFSAQTGAFSWVRPRAGPIGFARLHDSLPPSNIFCDEMVERHGIMILPSTTYDFGDRHVRVGFGRANFPAVLERVASAMRGQY